MAANGQAPIWLVAGDKLGDNAQVRMVAEALGLPCQWKHIAVRERYVLGKPPYRASLYHIDAQRSDALESPWPALVITSGRRMAMVAEWVRKQSGGKTRLVLIGRPKRGLARFDLVVATPQYRIPAADNVLRLRYPLMRADAARVAEAARHRPESLEGLPRPLTVALLGGPTQPFRFDAEALVRAIGRRPELEEGTLYVSTSRRTPPAAVAALKTLLPTNARLYAWSPDSAANPYLDLLAHGQRFIVTGDSLSMMIEVASLGRPLAIYALPLRGGAAARLRRWLGARLSALGLAGYPRDLTAVHRSLYADGLACPLEDGFSEPGRTMPDEVPGVVARIRDLVPQCHGL